MRGIREGTVADNPPYPARSFFGGSERHNLTAAPNPVSEDELDSAFQKGSEFSVQYLVSTTSPEELKDGTARAA
jgi:hypothetical protein